MPRFVHVPSPEPGSLRHRREGVGEIARFDGCPGRRRKDEPPLLPRRPGASPLPILERAVALPAEAGPAINWRRSTAS
jgi:hypothetical protein